MCKTPSSARALGREAGWAGTGQAGSSELTSRLLTLVVAQVSLLLWVSSGPVDTELGLFLEPAPCPMHSEILPCFGLWTHLSIAWEFHEVSGPLRTLRVPQLLQIASISINVSPVRTGDSGS